MNIDEIIADVRGTKCPEHLQETWAAITQTDALALCAEIERLRAVIAEARQAMEASELPFYRGMELLKGERP